MFRRFPCFRKKSKNVVDVLAEERQQAHDSQRRVPVPDTPAASKREPWWHRLFGRPMPQKKKHSSEKQSQPEKEEIRLGKRRWVTAACEDQSEPKAKRFKDLTVERHLGVRPKKEKQSVAISQLEISTYAEIIKKPSVCRKRRRVTAACEEQSEVKRFKGLTQETHIQTLPKKKREEKREKTLRQRKIKCLGFLNPAQICYINACLQSLLTLKDFVRAISSQEYLWNLIPEAALIRSFMNIKRSHLSGNDRHKSSLLAAFKSTIWSPEFQDLHQKDAHEFLTSVLEQMRCLSPQLQIMAASMGRTYSCPVEDHMVFKMVITRTCKWCGVGSTREEQFTNLSLDLVPGGGSVEQMLQDYLAEKELEFRCDCGATTSGQRSSFLTLPRVLVLHLKRFTFTPSLQLRKAHDPVLILRDMLVSSNQGGECYSLVSTINHTGLTASSGHYICDGLDQDVGEEDPTDRWFTYNDAEVTETSGDSVCDQRKHTSYILSYRRQD